MFFSNFIVDFGFLFHRHVFSLRGKLTAFWVFTGAGDMERFDRAAAVVPSFPQDCS
jgi:hypothetical protein